MAAWEYGGSTLQWWDGAAWSTADPTKEEGTTMGFRAWFQIINGDTGITPGNLQLEKRVDAGAWSNISTMAFNMGPGHDSTPADIAEWAIVLGPEWVGTVVDFRVRTEWTGGPYYDASDIISITVTSASTATMEYIGPHAQRRFEDFRTGESWNVFRGGNFDVSSAQGDSLTNPNAGYPKMVQEETP